LFWKNKIKKNIKNIKKMNKDAYEIKDYFFNNRFHIELRISYGSDLAFTKTKSSSENLCLSSD
jgi:hypothetical protein